MLRLTSADLSLIRVSIRTRIDAIESGLCCSFLSETEKKALIERHKRLLSALYDFSPFQTVDSDLALIKVLNAVLEP